jgi:hypothetical protein
MVTYWFLESKYGSKKAKKIYVLIAATNITWALAIAVVLWWYHRPRRQQATGE